MRPRRAGRPASYALTRPADRSPPLAPGGAPDTVPESAAGAVDGAPAQAVPGPTDSSGSAAADEPWDKNIEQEFEGCDAELLQQFGGGGGSGGGGSAGGPQSYPRKWPQSVKPVVPAPVTTNRAAAVQSARQLKASIAAVQTTSSLEIGDIDQEIARIRAQAQGKPQPKQLKGQKWLLDAQTRTLVDGARKGQLSIVQKELSSGTDP
eukprot:COSAG06_NODE_15759_length_1047_cov_1.040084_1_plen_206_part_10